MKTKILAHGVGLGSGSVTGCVRNVTDEASARAVQPGEIVYIEKLQGRYGDFAKRAVGFVVKANPVDHLATYLRETWKPAVLVDKKVILKRGQSVFVDAKNGTVSTGGSVFPSTTIEPLRYATKTKIYLQFSIPWLATEAKALGTAGVGLLRTNIILQETGLHPSLLFKKQRGAAFEKILFDAITIIAKKFAPDPVWVRTMDFATSDLKTFTGGSLEPFEHNPLMGWRGIARELDELSWLKAECRVFKKLIASGAHNVGVLFPMVRDITEYQRAKAVMAQSGLRPHTDIKVGCMFEVPSAALTIKNFIADGLDLAFIGANDLTQYTLATDRTNDLVKALYNPIHPAVQELYRTVLSACQEKNIETTTSFQPPMLGILDELVVNGLTSVTVHPDSINIVGKKLA